MAATAAGQATAAAAAATHAAPLACKLSVPAQLAAGAAAGAPVQLAFELRNAGAQPVELLTWGTPFEAAWFAPYVDVRRGTVALPYRGARMKRGDPPREQYLRIGPGETRHAVVDLGAVFDLAVPGRYSVEPRIVLHDVAVGADAATVPRPRDRHVAMALGCNAVEFEVAGR